MIGWQKELTERELKEVGFAIAYAESFNHGTDGHSRLILIAKLAKLLDSGYGNPVAVVVSPPKPFASLRKLVAIRD